MSDGNCGCDRGNGPEPGHFECRATKAGYRNIGRAGDDGWEQVPITADGVADLVIRPTGRAGDPQVTVSQARRTFDPLDGRVSVRVEWEDGEVWEATFGGEEWRAALAAAAAK